MFAAIGDRGNGPGRFDGFRRSPRRGSRGKSLGAGWVGREALAIGLHGGLVARDFGEAIRLAVVHSGDSDSTASLAGQLWGTANGSGQMPRTWMDRLDLIELLEALNSQLVDLNNTVRDQ
jgi:ADP-ribosylglycohydrolase